MSVEPRALLIVANSGRAMAESALRGGYQVAVLDSYCDRDTRALAPCAQLLDDVGCIDPELMLARASRIAPKQGALGLVYGAGMENAPSALHRLGARHRLFGNRAEVIDLLRNAGRFFELLDSLRIPHPEIRFTVPAGGSGRWLVKQAGSSGGQKVRRWREGQQLTAGLEYLQRLLDGPVMSALFIADGRRFRVIGYNRLAASPARTNEQPFLYIGAISHAPMQRTARSSTRTYIAALVRELGLRGLNSLDFVLHRGRPRVLELNARPSATVELYEQAVDDGWIKAHVRACLGELPEQPTAWSGQVHGHRVCYSSTNLRVPDDVRWPQWAKDLPIAGGCISRGQPLCSVFASGSDVDEVEGMLHQRKLGVDRITAAWPWVGT